MAAKIAAFLITLLINVAAGVAVIFGMLLGMNGYSESDANFGLITYIVLAVVVSLTMSVLSVVTVHLVMKRKYSSIAAALIAILVFAAAGAVLKVICSIIGVAVTELVRVNF